jgi:hypothetical protein
MKGILLVFLLQFCAFYSNAQINSSRTNLKGNHQITNSNGTYKLLVKFAPDAIIDFENGKPVFDKVFFMNNRTSLSNVLIDTFLYTQAIHFSPEERTQMRTRSMASPPVGKFNHFAFRGLSYINKIFDANEAVFLANEFEKYAFVEYVSIEPIDPITPPATPNFTSYQTYRFGKYINLNDVYGIDAEYAWSLGITGQGVKVADIEWGADYLHEDLQSGNFIEQVATNNHNYDDHGTAVAGIMIAKNNGFGVTGMVHGVDKFYGISELIYGRASGIAEGLKVLSPGDVFVYEMQTFGQNSQYVPADYDKAVWDITKSATDAGIIVVAAAGNGAQNLDDSYYDAYRARGDNGAIIVGAGTKSGRNTASFSSYGTPVHVQGWGDWSVASTGYTSLYNGGTHAGYTYNFSGTSSATPIAASAVVAVQSYCKQKKGITLTPLQMREILIQTGTPQGTGGHIGPLPNIKNAIEAIVNGTIKPVVSFNSPTNNQVYKMSPITTINLSATALDADGGLQNVYFTIGNIQIPAVLNNGKYVADWIPVSYGNYAVTVTATDVSLNVVSSTINVIVEIAPVNNDLSMNLVYKGSTGDCSSDFFAFFNVENKGLNAVDGYITEVYVNDVLVKTYTSVTKLNFGQKESFAIFNIPVTTSGMQRVTGKIIYPADNYLPNNEYTTYFKHTDGFPSQFYISASSMNPSGVWELKNSKGLVVASNGTTTSNGNLRVQDVCIADNDCYIFESVLPFQAAGCSTPAWVAGSQYCAGALVSYNGKVYKSSWCTTDNPISGQFNGWVLQGDCQQNIPTDILGIKKSDNSSTFFEISVADYSDPYFHEFCVGTLTSAHSYLEPETVAVYPNPVSDILHLSDDVISVEITNIFAQEFHKVDTQTRLINLSSYPQGIYLVRLHTVRGTTLIKLVKD